MIQDNDRDILIKYRLDQSRQSIGEVNKLIESDIIKYCSKSNILWDIL